MYVLNITHNENKLIYSSLLLIELAIVMRTGTYNSMIE